jgi:transposase
MSKRLGNPMYTLEFKQDAVKLVLEKGYTILEASSSLGISLSALNRWIKAERVGSGGSKSTLNLSEHDELIQLRKENARLKQEREILKKAAVFFAQETK